MAYNNLGSIYIKIKKYNEAISVLQQAIKLDPEKTEILNNLGNAYFNKGDYKNARAQWAKVVQMKPLDKTARENIKVLDEMGE